MGGAQLVGPSVEKVQTLDIAGEDTHEMLSYGQLFENEQSSIRFQFAIVQGPKGRLLLHGSPWGLPQDKEL